MGVDWRGYGEELEGVEEKIIIRIYRMRKKKKKIFNKEKRNFLIKKRIRLVLNLFL